MSKVFARKVSGLVREANLFDTFATGFMNNGVGVGLWSMTGWGLSLFPSGDMVIASVLTLILTTFGVGLTWGILGGSMPRSGGSYVYNSRIIHPAIGTAVSMANAGFVMTAWIYLLAPWISDPGMTFLLGTMRSEAAAWFATPAALFIIGTIASFIGFLILLFGLRSYFTIQRIFFTLGIIGVLIAGIFFTFNGQQQFINAWNAISARYNSLDYQGFINAVKAQGVEIPQTTDWVSTLGLMPEVAWAAAYGYLITFICGEVKRPEKNIILGQALANFIPSLICIWFAWALPHAVGHDFSIAAAMYEEGVVDVQGYNLPFAPHYVGMASVFTENPVLLFLMGFNFIAFDFIWVPISYLAFSRAAFAWGMDRLGPDWFTDINPRFASPVKDLVVEFILGEIGIALYAAWPEVLGGLAVTGLQAISVWGITGISCLILPFVKKAKHIWEASPYKWKIIGIPLATLAGVLNTIYMILILYGLYASEGLTFLMNIWTPIYIAVWIFGLLWYFIWRAYRARQGIDVTLAFKELPPE